MMSNAIGLIFLVCTLRVMCIVIFALGVSSGSIVNKPIVYMYAAESQHASSVPVSTYSCMPSDYMYRLGSLLHHSNVQRNESQSGVIGLSHRSAVVDCELRCSF